MKRVGSLVLIAAAAAGLHASRALAATTPALERSFSLPALVSNGRSTDLHSLFSVAGVASSVSMTSNGRGVLLTEVGRSSHGHPVFPIARPPRVSLGHIPSYRENPPSMGPIPEASTTLLYGLGFLAVGWAVLRSRRATSPHAG